MSDSFPIIDAVRQLIVANLARPAFVGEATGRPLVPYAVVNPDWEPEPDVGQELLDQPSALRVGIQVNSYGRANVDTLWLDSAVYTLMMAETQTFMDVEVIYRDADDSPVLSRTDTGLILGKHWYRFVVLR
jgi:hypothetical protein